MEKIKSIAITGKGGTGKTMVATLMIKILAERLYGKVLAIDADSAMSLPYTLGIKVKKTVSDMRKEIIGIEQVKRQIDSKPLKTVMEDIIENGNGFGLLTMGRPEEPGCYCVVNDLLRYGIDSLIEAYDITIIDGEAGPEQLNRRVLKSIDTLLVIADMSKRSLETAGAIMRIAQSKNSGINVKNSGLILNRVRDDEMDTSIELNNKTGMNILGCIPEDNILNSYDRAGMPLLNLPEDALSLTAARKILDKIIPL